MFKDLKRRERRLSPYFDGFPNFRQRFCEISTGKLSKSLSRRPLDLHGFMRKSSKHSRRCLRRFNFPLFICAAHRMRPTHPAASSSGAGRCRIWSGLEAMPPRKRSLSSGRAPTRLLARRSALPGMVERALERQEGGSPPLIVAQPRGDARAASPNNVNGFPRSTMRPSFCRRLREAWKLPVCPLSPRRTRCPMSATTTGFVA